MSVPTDAEQLRGHPVARVDARELGDELQPLDLQRLDLAGARGRDVAGEVDEAGVAAGELAQELVLGLVEQRRRAGAATRGGSLIRYGVAAIVIAGWETASSMPLRSVIAPRRAGTTRSASCWVAAALLERAGLDDAEPGGLAGRR